MVTSQVTLALREVGGAQSPGTRHLHKPEQLSEYWVWNWNLGLSSVKSAPFSSFP